MSSTQSPSLLFANIFSQLALLAVVTEMMRAQVYALDVGDLDLFNDNAGIQVANRAIIKDYPIYPYPDYIDRPVCSCRSP